MKIKQIAKIKGGQDGAIYGSELFRFDEKGNCTVYNLKDIDNSNIKDLVPIAEFRLDRSESLPPHSNSVCFGCEFYQNGDTYPLLYSNIYNNFSKENDKLIGVCLVYRIEKAGAEFKSTLVQAIEIGFTNNHQLWKAEKDEHGVRPYGNFLVDRESGSFYAFVMRNEQKGTRYFKFDLPSVFRGTPCPKLGVKKVVLLAEDIKESFDLEYHRFIQGATVHGGKIYSTEGFSNDLINRPAIRIIDLKGKSQEYFDITTLGIFEEPEFIDVYDGNFLYSDFIGNLYSIEL